jgi:hypothetical protein
MINFFTQITDEAGDVVKQNYKSKKTIKGKLIDGTVYRETTLEDVARTALLSSFDDDKDEDILPRYQLFRKIYHKGEIELTKEEKTLLKRLICKKHEVLFAGQALELIQ